MRQYNQVIVSSRYLEVPDKNQEVPDDVSMLKQCIYMKKTNLKHIFLFYFWYGIYHLKSNSHTIESVKDPYSVQSINAHIHLWILFITVH